MSKNVKMKVSVSFLILLVSFISLSFLPYANAFWSFSINPSNRSVQPGGTTQFTVVVSGSNPKPIKLIYSPPEIGVTVTFSTSIGNAPYTALMIVHVDPAKPPGSYTLFIDAYPQGDLYPGPTVQGNPVTLHVVAPIFDFTLTLSPPINEVEQGETAQFNIMLTYSDPSFSGTVINYQVIGLGPGMNWIPAGGGLIRISTSPTTPPGTYPITVIGSALGVTHQTIASLVVEEAPEEPTPTQTLTETTTQIVTETPTEVTTETPSEEEQRQLEEEERQREEEERLRREEELRIQEEAREQRLLTYLVIGILVIVLLLLAVVLMRRRQASSQQAQVSTKYCGNCGEPLEPGKAFCSSCGEKVKK